MKACKSIFIPLLALLFAGCSKSPDDQNVTYQILGRNGVTYRITNAPSGLSKEQIKQLVLRNHPEAGIEAPMYMPGSDGGMVVGGPLNGTLMPGSRGGMVVGGPLNGTLMPPSD